MLAEITLIRRPGEPDQGLPGSGGAVTPPIYYPDQVWPPNGLPPLPPGIDIPPGWWTKPPGEGLWPIKPPDWPIVIPIPPDKPQPGLPPRPDQGLPPAQGRPDQGLPPVAGRPDQGPIEPPTLWPPLPPDAGIAGKALLLIWVVGVGYRWLVVSAGLPTPPIYTPPPAQPK